jgi:tetratricopeptide (TPR) repeat protein
MAKSTIYTVGGTVQAGGGVYIKRKADDELLELCQHGQIALVLSSRQVGKSSLMVRTSEQLEENNIRSVIIDLSTIGVQVTPNEWYLGILNEIKSALYLKTDIFAWWGDNAKLGFTQRLIKYFRDVLLAEVSENVVLFFDEIDSTLSIPFSDDFFAALRAVYNARSTNDEFKRLSFVLIGVATPSDLITDSKRTPFNLGHRVELTDFTLEEARPLTASWGKHSEQALNWIFQWTNGHPYLTQRLCSYLANREEALTEHSVEVTVAQLFKGEQGWQDNNLQFVKDMLAKRAHDVHQVLKIYKDIRSGKKVTDDERSIPKAHLKISGVVRRRNGLLIPRNRIYAEAFDLSWIKQNTPPTTTRRLIITSSLVTTIALIMVGYFALQQRNLPDAERATLLENAFRSAGTYQERLDSLAGMFLLPSESFENRAGNLFNSLDYNQQLELFTPTTAQAVKEDQLVVALKVYQSLGWRTETDERGDELLTKMRDAMNGAGEEQKLRDEISAWLAGRAALSDESYPRAKDEISEAIRINNTNPALYFDRARAYIGMGANYYTHALEDLTQLVQLDPSRNIAVKSIITNNDAFQSFWESNAQSYPELADAVTLPTLLASGGADKVAFIANKDIFIMNVDGTELSQLTADGAAKSDLQWLPDGNTLLFISGTAVKTYNIATDSVDTIASFPSASSLDAFQVSHDGKSVMISVNLEIYVISFDIKAMRRVTSRDDLLSLNPCIIPEGNTISALLVRDALWSADDKLVSWLYKGFDANAPSSLADEVGIFDIQGCNPSAIDVLDTFPGSRFTPVGYEENRAIPALDWDGASLFVFNTLKQNNGWGDLYTYNWENHREIMINPVSGRCCYRDARWSPDGSYILFAFQDADLGTAAPTVFYYVPLDQLGASALLTPISMPNRFFQDPGEAPQPALRPAQ